MSETLKNQTLDIRNYRSPLSVLKVKSLLNEMKDGQILEVLSNDFETLVVLGQIIENSSDELIGVEQKDEHKKISIKRRAPIDH